MVDLLFGSLDAYRIVAEIITGNDASVRLAKRLGFRQEARFVKSLKLSREWRDELVYSILKDDWQSNTAAQSAAVSHMGGSARDLLICASRHTAGLCPRPASGH